MRAGAEREIECLNTASFLRTYSVWDGVDKYNEVSNVFEVNWI